MDVPTGIDKAVVLYCVYYINNKAAVHGLLRASPCSSLDLNPLLRVLLLDHYGDMEEAVKVSAPRVMLYLSLCTQGCTTLERGSGSTCGPCHTATVV